MSGGELSSQLCDSASAAARSVRDLLRAGFASRSSVAMKDDFHDLVTEYDTAAELEIRQHLTAAVPGSRVVGEEDGGAGDGEVCWYVDPIDGTNNFAGGVPFFCVAIGATYRDELVAGVVYDPLRDELFTANRQGAWLDAAPIRSTGAAVDGEAVLGTDFPHHKLAPFERDGVADADRFADMIRSFRTVRRLGSGELMLAYVAAGRLDATVGLNAKPWDVAAGAMLVRAAGGTYVPLVGAPRDGAPLWEVPSYLAVVHEFDLAGSCLASLERMRHG